MIRYAPTNLDGQHRTVTHNRHISTKKDDGSRPTLRRSPNGTIDDGGDDQKVPKDQDERPTLKRRDNDQT
jgi:hypothetical protein